MQRQLEHDRGWGHVVDRNDDGNRHRRDDHRVERHDWHGHRHWDRHEHGDHDRIVDGQRRDLHGDEPRVQDVSGSNMRDVQECL